MLTNDYKGLNEFMNDYALYPQNNPITLEDAAARVRIVTAAIEDVCQQVHITGSIRRGKPNPDDADVVVVPADPARLLARLDKLVANGVLHQAIYPDGKTRWGQKYRGLSVAGFKIELFLADGHNAGYQIALRTGPHDANKYIMTALQSLAGVQCRGGYVWRNGKKISVPDEDTFFMLLRMHYVDPDKRSEQAYRRTPKTRYVTDDRLTFVTDDAPTQRSMF